MRIILRLRVQTKGPARGDLHGVHNHHTTCLESCLRRVLNKAMRDAAFRE